MINVLAAALLAAPWMTLPASDTHAQHLSDVCLAAAVAQFGEGPGVHGSLEAMKVRRDSRAWTIDYEVTLQDRVGRSHQWVGRCTLAAPRVELAASN